MAYNFNPFTGNFDEAGAAPVAEPAGSDTQIQYNDDGALAGSADLTWDDTEKVLGVGGDVNLDDGGTFTTTLQTVTPTANRTISFPDATGTIALTAGSSGQLLYNASGANAGLSTVTTDGTNVTLSGRFISSLNGAASAPPGTFTGTWFTGGTSTTTKPQVVIEPTGTTSTAWSTSGTGLGVNAASGFAGNLLDLQVNGTRQLSITSGGEVNTNNKLTLFGGLSGNNTIFNVRSATTGSASPTDDVFRITRIGAESFTYAFLPNRTDRGLEINAASGGATFSVVGGGTISFASSNFTTGPATVSNGAGFGTTGIYIGRTLLASTFLIQSETGTALSDVAPGSIEIRGKAAKENAATNLNGGIVQINGGAGATASAGSANGGAVTLNGGQAFGTGIDGNIIIGATRGNLQITDARNVILGTTTGTKIGTATTQKLGFYNATPVVQPTAVADITTTATTGTLPTPDGTVTIADATTPTVTELLEYCVELESKLEAALGHLRTLGLIAT